MISNQIWFYVYFFILGFLFCQALIPLAKRVGRSLNMVDQPGERHIHKSKILTTGGMALYFTSVIVIVGHIAGIYFFHTSQWFQDQFPLLVSNIYRIKLIAVPLMALLVGSTIIFLLGFYDDKKKVPLKIKWFLQFLAAFIALWGGIRVTFTGIALLDSIVTVLWIVGITNAFNLLDNMNGLSAGVATVSASIFLIVVIDQGQFFMALILSLFIGSLLGFLPYNFPKARLFLGDQGSLFIGFLLACLTILASFTTAASPTHFGVLMPLFVLAIPLFDTASVIIIRLKEKRSIFKGDTSHLSHRLVAMGLSQTMSVILIYFLTFIFGLASILLINASLKVGVILLVQLIFMCVVISILMIYGGENKHKS